jgi:hypothetical protein
MRNKSEQFVIVHILSDIYSTLKSFQQFYIQDTSVLDSHSVQLVMLPYDGPVRPKLCTHGSWWLM